jgi:hypothetical protein
VTIVGQSKESRTRAGDPEGTLGLLPLLLAWAGSGRGRTSVTGEIHGPWAATCWREPGLSVKQQSKVENSSALDLYEIG